jgi:hypothetical protein
LVKEGLKPKKQALKRFVTTEKATFSSARWLYDSISMSSKLQVAIEFGAFAGTMLGRKKQCLVTLLLCKILCLHLRPRII